MSARGDNNFMRYVYMGQEGEFIPLRATHIIVHESVKVMLADAFLHRVNIVEVICHEDVEKIEEYAFFDCRSLRRVVMPGVKIVKKMAFYHCNALSDVECGKLEIIIDGAFGYCASLKSINLPSARIIGEGAFCACIALTDATFGSKLERFDRGAFLKCTSLAQVTIPLKDGIIPHDSVFAECRILKHVDLVESSLIQDTIVALHLEEWRNHMKEEIDSINQTLPTADAGEVGDAGEKAVSIRTWIGSDLRQLGRYKAEHCRILDEDVAPTLQHVLPQDIVMNSILPFLELPSNSTSQVIAT